MSRAEPSPVVSPFRPSQTKYHGCLAAVALVYGATWKFLRRGVIAIASTLAIHMVVAATLLLAGKSGDPNIGFGMTWLVLFCVLYLVTIVGCILGEVDEAKDR